MEEKKISSFLHDFRRYLEQLSEDGQEYVVLTGKERIVSETGERKKTAAEASPLPSRSEKPPSSAPSATLRELEEKVKKCGDCRLGRGRRNAVCGEGGMREKVMFIGEGPGENEDLQGRPFVGRAGQLLDKILASIGLERSDVYITNIVKCRPPNNRDPRPDEIVACWKFLKEQIRILKPRVIVALGSPAAKTLLETDQGISQLRGKFHQYEGIPLLPTFHPAYLLRTYTVENRQKVWDDMKKLKEFLEKEGV